MLRLLLLGSACALLSVQAFGQIVVQGKPNFPINPSLPRLYAPNSQALSGGAIPGLTARLPFRTWQELLKKDPARDEQIKALREAARVMGSPGQCSVPLIRLPLPEHFDDRMVDRSILMASRHLDDKIAIEPPPDCPLHSSRTGSSTKPLK